MNHSIIRIVLTSSAGAMVAVFRCAPERLAYEEKVDFDLSSDNNIIFIANINVNRCDKIGIICI